MPALHAQHNRQVVVNLRIWGSKSQGFPKPAFGSRQVPLLLANQGEEDESSDMSRFRFEKLKIKLAGAGKVTSLVTALGPLKELSRQALVSFS
jgi:hypothetical protein